MFMIELKALQTNGSDRDGKWNVVHELYPLSFFFFYICNYNFTNNLYNVEVENVKQLN
jgi:hypothetical protein